MKKNEDNVYLKQNSLGADKFRVKLNALMPSNYTEIRQSYIILTPQGLSNFLIKFNYNF